MFGIGALIRVFRRAVSGYQQADHLRSAIAVLEHESAQPVLASFEGAARFDAAVCFCDATLIRRLQAQPSDAERRGIISGYLQKCHEEYIMAKSDLDAKLATRAEVVALGLALREIALTFDEEIADFRNRSAVLMEEQRTSLLDTGALARQRVDEAILRMSAEVRSAVQRIERELQSNIDASFSRQAHDVAEHIASAERRSDEQGQRLSKQLSEGLAQQSQRLAEFSDESRRSNAEQKSWLTTRVDKHEAQIRATLETIGIAQRAFEFEIKRSVETMRADQANTFRMLGARIRLNRWLLALSIALTVIALVK